MNALRPLALSLLVLSSTAFAGWADLFLLMTKAPMMRGITFTNVMALTDPYTPSGVASPPGYPAAGSVEWYYLEYARSHSAASVTFTQSLNMSLAPFGAYSTPVFRCAYPAASWRKSTWSWGSGLYRTYALSSTGDYLVNTTDCLNTGAVNQGLQGYLIPPSLVLEFERMNPTIKTQPVLTCAHYTTREFGTWRTTSYTLDGEVCDQVVLAGFTSSMAAKVVVPLPEPIDFHNSVPTSTNFTSYTLSSTTAVDMRFVLRSGVAFNTFTAGSAMGYAGNTAALAGNGVVRSMRGSISGTFSSQVPCVLNGATYVASAADGLLNHSLSDYDFCSLANFLQKKDLYK